MTIRFWSPLPPAHTGVADYSATLLEELRPMARVVTNPAEPEAIDDAIDLYHIGNNSFHREAYLQALERPGVVVIHDAVLQHFFIGSLGREAYIEEFVYNYGEWRRPFAETLWRERERASSDARYFEWPMLRRIAEKALGIVVHNPAAEAVLLQHAPEARVAVIPHLFEPVAEPPMGEVRELRAEWGVGEDTLLIGVFGFLRETKRLPAVLRAFERARARGADLALLVAGEFVAKEMEDTLRAELSQPGVIRRGYVSEPEFWRQAHAVDVCVNLRVPSAAESSGIATRLMGIGKPVFLTEGRELGHLPVGAYVPITSGVAEEAELEQWLLALCARRELAREMGRAAQEHIRAEHDAGRVAARYYAFLHACRGAQLRPC